VTFFNLAKEEEKLLDIKYKNIKHNKKKAIEKSLASVSLTHESANEFLSRSTLLRIVESLCKPKEHDPEFKFRKRFIQLYASTFSNDNETSEKEKIDTSTFIKELVSIALTYYIAPVPLIKKTEENGVTKETIKEPPPHKFYDASNRIVNFVLREIKKTSTKDDFSKPISFDDNEEEKANADVNLTWEELVNNSFDCSIFNLLWDTAFCSAFITTPLFKVKIILFCNFYYYYYYYSFILKKIFFFLLLTFIQMIMIIKIGFIG